MMCRGQGRSTVVAIASRGLRVGNDQVDEVSLVTVPVSGFPQFLALPHWDAQRLSTGSSSATMVIRGKDGNYQVRSGALWQSQRAARRNFPAESFLLNCLCDAVYFLSC